MSEYTSDTLRALVPNPRGTNFVLIAEIDPKEVYAHADAWEADRQHEELWRETVIKQGVEIEWMEAEIQYLRDMGEIMLAVIKFMKGEENEQMA